MDYESFEDEAPLRMNRSTGREIRGMDSVVATVSGYHGSKRFKLIKLINHTGASYLGALTKSTTHLVCWCFEGRKYDLAKEFGTIIVSHRWFEDCVKAGKRLPERHYVMKSGQQVGPLLWEVPHDSENGNLISTKKESVLSDRSNTFNAIREVDIGARSFRRDSCLLSENFSCDLGMKENFHKSRKSMAQKNSKGTCRLRSTNGFFPRSDKVQHEESFSDSSTFYVGHKRNIESAIGSSTMVPTRRSRRLVKRNARRESTASYNGEEYTTLGFRSQLNCTVVDIDDCNNPTNGNATTIAVDQEYSLNEINNITTAINDRSNVNGLASHGRNSLENRNEEVEDVEDITELKNIATPVDSNKLDENLVPAQETASQHGDSNPDENCGRTLTDAGKSNGARKLHMASGLSCVICWTDFSSTRGVLPCGHRFCYSCIQSWADHMASIRKASTCPLCKASFMSITKVDGAGSSDQKIYSQTIPYDSSTNTVFLPDWEISHFGAQSSSASFCCECRFREPEDLLICCHLCSNRWVHSYCLDPPLVPWTCTSCRDLRSRYQRMY